MTRQEFGRTMVEMILVILILGLLAVSGTKGFQWGYHYIQAGQTFTQVNEIAQGVEELYSFAQDYSVVSMDGDVPICGNGVLSDACVECSTGQCWKSRWNGDIYVVAVNRDGEAPFYQIIYTDTPRDICNMLRDMPFAKVSFDSNCIDDANVILRGMPK